ncbi:hypothetical protein GCM10011313_01570 [Mycetocola zhadangensis]|nr:hypothetical protein GCM10011313_01570 [Mycetocola zhadangensis]
MSEWTIAVACGGWTVVFLLPESEWAAPIALVWAIVILLLPQRPIIGAITLALLQTGLVLTGPTADNPAALASLLIAVYYLGRHAPLRWGAPVGALFLVEVIADRGDATTLVFAAALLAGMFAFGRLVQLRAEAAARAKRVEAALSGVDAEQLAESIVARERIRLGTQALEIIRSSVDVMRAEATQAMDDLDPARIQSIVDRGSIAVEQLRRLLGILRSPASAPSPRIGPSLTRPWADFGIAAALVLLAVAELISSGHSMSPLGWALAISFPLTVVLRRPRPTIAAASAAGIVILMVLVPAPLLTGWGAAGLVTLILLSWSSAAAGQWHAWAAYAALLGSTIIWFATFGPENIPMSLAILGLSAFAASEWSLRNRERLSASTHADRLQSELDQHIHEAVRLERLRIARDLHDVTSHAVGVMVLQASAAQANLRRDPAAARHALLTVQTAGEQALTELGMLVSLLEAAENNAGPGSTLLELLDALASRVRALGLDVEIDADDAPNALIDLAYHVVREGLTNVIRHSKATRVTVEVRATEQTLTIRVTDNGEGARTEAAGFGLSGMSERVQDAGGQFAATTGPGGFQVVADIPIESKAPRS